MAESAPSNDTPALTQPSPSSSSSFKRTVSLYSWWLIKAENDFHGKRFAVAGVSSRKEEAMRVFASTPVIKRYDMSNLETSDGTFIILNGFIDEQRMLENGFAPEVFNRFLFGFPPDWETYVLDCLREESTSIDSGNIVANDVSEVRPEILPDGVEKSIPTSLVSSDKVPGDSQKPFPNAECNASKETDGGNVSHANGGSRRSARLHKIKVCQQKNQLASGGAQKHPDKKQRATLENCEVEGLKSSGIPTGSQSPEQVNTFSEQLLQKSTLRISQSPGQVNTLSEQLLKKSTSGTSLSQGKANTSSEQLFQLQSPEQVNTFSEQLLKKSASITSQLPGLVSTSSEKLLEKSASRTSRSQRKVNTSSGQILKKSASRTSQSRGKVNTSSEHLIKKSASRISRTLSPKTEGRFKKKEGMTKTVTPKKKMTGSASPVKHLQGRDVGKLIKERKPELSSLSPESLSSRKSRSGRLLVPPLEFWRNQIPVYNADHEIKEIQEGACLVSPCRGSSPSLSRFSNQKRAA